MIKASVTYKLSPNSHFDMDYYLQEHTALVHKLCDDKGLVRLEVDRSSETGEVIAYLLFDSLEVFQATMGEVGDQLAADAPNYTDIQPVMSIIESLYSK